MFHRRTLRRVGLVSNTVSIWIGPIQPLSKMSTKKFHLGKLRVARTAEDSAVLLVSNVKVRMEAQLFYHVHMCFLSVRNEGNPVTKLGKLNEEKNSG